MNAAVLRPFATVLAPEYTNQSNVQRPAAWLLIPIALLDLVVDLDGGVE